MNKKSAIVTASGLVTSFVAGVAAVSFNWGLGHSTATQAAAVLPETNPSTKPIIKHRTITIHKKSPTSAATSAQAPRTVVMPGAGTSMTSPLTTTSGSHGTGGDDSHESGDGGGGDD